MEGTYMKTIRITKKICLLGDPAVGKTSLIHRYVYDAFDDKYLSTIGAKITKKANLVQIPEAGLDVELSLLIWDIAGQRMFANVHQAYYKGAEGALLVADVTRRETFESIVSWISELFNVSGSVPVLILANKYDLMKQGAITEQEIEDIVGELGATYLFTSAKTGINVESAFGRISEFLARQAVQG